MNGVRLMIWIDLIVAYFWVRSLSGILGRVKDVGNILSVTFLSAVVRRASRVHELPAHFFVLALRWEFHRVSRNSQLNPWIRGLLEKLTVTQVLNKFTVIAEVEF